MNQFINVSFNLLKTKHIHIIQGLCVYCAVNTLHFGYKTNLLMFFQDPYKRHKFLVITMNSFLMLNLVVRKVTGML